MPDLHGWITQQIDEAERVQRESRNVLDEHGRYDHTEFSSDLAVLLRCAADRKILAAHPYTTRVINPGDGTTSAGFGCETCHDWDGVPEGRGNCVTILALAEAHGWKEAPDAGT